MLLKSGKDFYLRGEGSNKGLKINEKRPIRADEFAFMSLGIPSAQLVGNRDIAACVVDRNLGTLDDLDPGANRTRHVPRFRAFHQAPTRPPDIFLIDPHSVAHHPPPIRKKAVQLTTGEKILEKHAPPSAPPSAPEQTPACTGAAETTAPFNSRASSPRNWPRWLLTPEPSDKERPDKEPPDKRKFPREVLPWVAAYFFTGGPPSPSSVRDISMSGMFVVTAERWYLGTIIRFTLTDWRVQPPDRYVTINAEAVRWGDDGVGLRFLFQKRRRGEHNRTVPLFVDVTPRQLHEFLRCFKPGTSPQNLRN